MHLASALALCSRLCSRRVWCECSAPGRWATDDCPCFSCDRECDPDGCGSCGAHRHLATGVDGEQPFGGFGGESEATAPRVGVLAATDPVAGGVTGNRRCRNLQMQVGLRVLLVLGRSDAHDFGVFAAERAVKRDFVIEYVREMVPQDDAHTRGRVYVAFGVSYLYTLTRSVVLDACRIGSRMRYVNHSRPYHTYIVSRCFSRCKSLNSPTHRQQGGWHPHPNQQLSRWPWVSIKYDRQRS